MPITISHATTADGSFSVAGAIAWNAGHALAGAVSQQVVFGSTGGGLTQDATLTYASSVSTLSVGAIVVAGTTDFATPLISIRNLASPTANGSDLRLQAQNGGSVSGNAGNLVLNAGSAVTGLAGGVFLGAGEVGTGDGGVVQLSAGFPSLSGAGGSINLLANNAAGANQDGGNVLLYAGERTGTGAQGYVGINGRLRAYQVANSTGAVTITAVRPAAVANATIQAWLPLMVDGTLYHIPLWS